MESYLDKKEGFFAGWVKYFFILHEDVLMQLDKEGGKPMGSIHMRIAKIQPDPKDKLVIKVFNGTNEIYLRTKNIKEQVDWYNALTNTQKNCNEGRYHQYKSKASARLSAGSNLYGSQNGSFKSPSKPPSENGRISVAAGDDSSAYGFTGSMHERLNMRFFSKVF